MRKWAGAFAVLAMAVAAWLFFRPVPDRIADGETVFIISPVAAATYDNGGRTARDDEPLYGMRGIVAGGGEDGALYSVRMRYGYTIRLQGKDFLPRSRVPKEWWSEPGHVVAGACADVLAAPDLKAFPPLMTLPRGAHVWSAGEEGEYRRVVLHSGETGYVRSVLLREVRNWEHGDERTNRERVAADAMTYSGAPYRWGGKTPAGIDCSGLASMVYLLNGLAIHRNSVPRAGYPVALMHIPLLPGGGYDRHSLTAARKGDLLYWQGHQGVYLGNGKYIHANATAYSVTVNSLFRNDPDYEPELAKSGAVLTWGTAYPKEPEKLIVRQFVALPTGEPGRFRFYARLDGYAPTTAVLYPEGVGEGKPGIVVDNPGDMVYGPLGGQGKNVPAHTYAGKGKYHPVVEFTNADGWLPAGAAIATGRVRMAAPVVIE